VLLSCNPRRAPVTGLSVAIDLPTGPEIVTGSTRLKAGTATKLVLNMFSTIAMVRAGRVKDNLMIHVQATNEKLRDRATRLVMELRSCGRDEAVQQLQKAKWSVAKALR
jgi:N-acetylmuramic acid 6-phosphate (MurNAc-6-P) etherase